MAGMPPPGPPKLGYRSKRQLEEEERARAEAEQRAQEEERLLKEREEAALRKQTEAAATRVAEERRVWGAAQGPIAAPAPVAARVARLPEAPPPMPGAAAPAPPPPAAAAAAMRPSAMAIPPTLGTVHELRYAPPPELLAPPAAVEEAAPAPVVSRPRRPPRPPRSPDLRPVWAGFLLVGVGLTELLWGLVAMARAPGAGEGAWADVVEWAAFSAGFSAAVLGAFAVRGGLWSFRKERYDRVKWGAVCATICVWALWVPWVVGFAALLIVHAARDEYYPNYDPARDAPEWARPPPGRAKGAAVDAGAGGAAPDGEGEAQPPGQPSPSSQT